MRARLAVLLCALVVAAEATSQPGFTVKLVGGWYVPQDQMAQMQPIACHAGFRYPRASDAALLTSLLDAEFAAARATELRRKLPLYYCRRGVASKSYTVVSGCVSDPEFGTWAQVTGVVTYTCVGSKKTLQLGLEADGEYSQRRHDW